MRKIALIYQRQVLKFKVWHLHDSTVAVVALHLRNKYENALNAVMVLINVYYALILKKINNGKRTGN